MAETAGQRLRKEFDAALDRASKQLGKRLRWDEKETHALDAAVAATDRRDQLAKVFDAELAGEKRTGVLVNLSNELRQLDKAIAFHIGNVRVGVGVAKDKTKQRAAHERWRRHQERLDEEADHGVG